ncbi:hypothetical protein GUITHDRAFT_120339 [Guillardia theta CCMP2712]|uniref:Uncharacterized protein n=1 Tax=Guillardia theta (strain CCMP2712) TaxID=905079 RepID=L1IC30_GUITC|nr:hypothetical protein GUITHDRAFT_120339 [Guillardia theta CCMP2712]EKX33489.1 hypothetical protein GUITHDRAFT_120339 [Guillardia theta CCMP2712]|eukprot:XP_005820469.1 hypothetical protein GUITHDRAFT_120339 [Guillardia theta CCMP2712]
MQLRMQNVLSAHSACSSILVAHLSAFAPLHQPASHETQLVPSQGASPSSSVAEETQQEVKVRRRLKKVRCSGVRPCVECVLKGAANNCDVGVAPMLRLKAALEHDTSLNPQGSVNPPKALPNAKVSFIVGPEVGYVFGIHPEEIASRIDILTTSPQFCNCLRPVYKCYFRMNNVHGSKPVVVRATVERDCDYLGRVVCIHFLYDTVTEEDYNQDIADNPELGRPFAAAVGDRRSYKELQEGHKREMQFQGKILYMRKSPVGRKKLETLAKELRYRFAPLVKACDSWPTELHEPLRLLATDCDSKTQVHNEAMAVLRSLNAACGQLCMGSNGLVQEDDSASSQHDADASSVSDVPSPDPFDSHLLV